MKDSVKRTKTLYIVLLVCTVAAVIAAVTLSLVFGLGGEKVNPIITPPGVNDNDNTIIDDNNDNTDIPDPGDDEIPVVTDPVPVYQSPVSEYTLGLGCDLETFVKSSTLGWYTTHNGTDFLAEEGSVVKSVYDGTVREVGYSTLDGYYVVIEQTDGIMSTYKSLLDGITVSNGDTVYAGTVIGAVGNSMTSEQNDGAHLHLEMKENGQFIDPMSKLTQDDK